MSAVQAAINGGKLRCPKCGQGSLFRAYLKPVATCSACGEALGHIRADDGPAWLTILITGHVVLGLALAVETYTTWPMWVSMTVWPALILIGALALLPVAKGLFIGVIWATGATGEDPGS